MMTVEGAKKVFHQIEGKNMKRREGEEGDERSFEK